MKTRTLLISVLFFSIIFSLCSQSVFNLKIEPIYIHPESVDDIRVFTIDSIPPYIYTDIPDLKKMDVPTRKKKFIELILPAILFEKFRIKKMYNMIDDKSPELLYNYCGCETKQELYYCLTEQPNSIIIAQAAMESGWGTSRFFLEGFNLFGIHSFDENDLKIKAEGSDTSSPVYVKKYDSLLLSVSDYLRTLGRSNAYSEFRIRRFQNDSVENLLLYLKKYSIRRELYIKDLQDIIEYNDLFIYDNIEINVE